MKKRGIMEVQFHYVLTCGTGEINWSAAQSCPFVLRETVPGMHWTRNRAGRSLFGGGWKGKGLCSWPEQ